MSTQLLNPGIVSTLTRIAQVPAGPILGPLAIENGFDTARQAGLGMEKTGPSIENLWELAKGGIGMLSGAAGATGLAGQAILAGEAGGAGAAFAASGVGAAGAVGGAGLAGYGAGHLLSRVANSEYARSRMHGQDGWGRNRTRNDKVIDDALSMDAWIDDATGTDIIGDAAGGAYAMGMSVLETPGGLVDSAAGLVTSLFD